MHRRPEDLRFLLDANLSYRVADELEAEGLHVRHVSKVPGLMGPSSGQSRARDEEIAEWCGINDYVLITCDSDFRGRLVRSGALETANAEVIVFTHELAGLHNQLAELRNGCRSGKRSSPTTRVDTGFGFRAVSG